MVESLGSIATVIHVIVCVVIILFVLLQSGKGAEAGALFGGSSNTVFGGGGAANFLVRVTAGAGALFFVTSVLLAAIGTMERSSVIDRVDVAEATLDQVAPGFDPAFLSLAVSDTTTGEPIDFYVSLDGTAAQAVSGGTTQLEILNDETHSLEITAPGYGASLTTVSLGSGETRSLSLGLAAE